MRAKNALISGEASWPSSVSSRRLMILSCLLVVVVTIADFRPPATGGAVVSAGGLRRTLHARRHLQRHCVLLPRRALVAVSIGDDAAGHGVHVRPGNERNNAGPPGADSLLIQINDRAGLSL
jgi:hypothetical protein